MKCVLRDRRKTVHDGADVTPLGNAFQTRAAESSAFSGPVAWLSWWNESVAAIRRRTPVEDHKLSNTVLCRRQRYMS